MTYHEKRRQAEDLLKRNYPVSEIAKELGLQIRTVSRWAKLLREGKPEPKSKPESVAIVKSEVVEQIQSVTSEPKLLSFNGTYQEWDTAITNKFKQLEEFHCNERLKCQSLRDQKIAEGEINSRDINNFSQAMTRHGEQEIKMLCMGKVDLLSLSQAYAMVKTAGFTIVKTRIEEDDTLSRSNTTSEIAGESGEGHTTTES